MRLSHPLPLATVLAALALGAPLAAQVSADPPKTDETKTLNKAVDKALKDPKLVARLAEAGGVPMPMSPAEFGKLVAEETEAVAAVGNDAEKINAENQAQYEADVAAYRDAVKAHAMATMKDDARYARQQRAYADAMAQWRIQVAECKKGSKTACDLPTPAPAAYY